MKRSTSSITFNESSFALQGNLASIYPENALHEILNLVFSLFSNFTPFSFLATKNRPALYHVFNLRTNEVLIFNKLRIRRSQIRLLADSLYIYVV